MRTLLILFFTTVALGAEPKFQTNDDSWANYWTLTDTEACLVGGYGSPIYVGDVDDHQNIDYYVDCDAGATGLVGPLGKVWIAASTAFDNDDQCRIKCSAGSSVCQSEMTPLGFVYAGDLSGNCL